jgi:8-oxo-dGTP diphosphatase
MNRPVFGVRVDGCHYRVRPSAYAILRDSGGLVAIVREGRGWFLPGGGVEPGETAEQAVVREVREECGFTVRVGRVVASAIQIVHSPAGHSGVDKDSVFFEAAVEVAGTPTQVGTEVVWMTREEAARRLSHASHRWVLLSI